MKKLILATLTFITILSSCNQKIQYTENSAEIDTYKKVLEDYENGNLPVVDVSHQQHNRSIVR